MVATAKKLEEIRKVREWAMLVYEGAHAKAERLDPNRQRTTSIVQSLDAIAAAANWTRLLCDVELEDAGHK